MKDSTVQTLLTTDSEVRESKLQLWNKVVNRPGHSQHWPCQNCGLTNWVKQLDAMSSLSVCFCPFPSCCWCIWGQCSLFCIKGNARWLLLGKFCLLSHWCLSPYLTSADVDALCDPTTLVPLLPPSLGGVCLCHHFHATICWHTARASYPFIRVPAGKETFCPPFAFGVTSNYLSILIANLIQGLTVGGMGGQTDFSPW